MSTTVFWIYVCASLVLLVGLIKVFNELPHEHGVDKIMPFGWLFFAISLAVFGSEHFTATASIATLVPRWIPAHVFWVYLVGVAFFCAAIGIALLIQARLAAALVGMTMFVFVLVMDLPAVAANPHNRFFWALALRQLAFSGGAFAFAMSARSTRPKPASPARPAPARTALPRFFVGVPRRETWWREESNSLIPLSGAPRVSPAALPRWWRRRSSSSASSPRRHAWPRRRRPQAHR